MSENPSFGTACLYVFGIVVGLSSLIYFGEAGKFIAAGLLALFVFYLFAANADRR